jgi:hypothetical protein
VMAVAAEAGPRLSQLVKRFVRSLDAQV